MCYVVSNISHSSSNNVNKFCTSVSLMFWHWENNVRVADLGQQETVALVTINFILMYRPTVWFAHTEWLCDLSAKSKLEQKFEFETLPRAVLFHAQYYFCAWLYPQLRSGVLVFSRTVVGYLKFEKSICHVIISLLYICLVMAIFTDQ